MSDATLANILTVLVDLQVRLAALEGGKPAAGGAVPAVAAASAGPAETPLSPTVKAYDEFIATYVTPLVAQSKLLGAEGEKIGNFIEQGFGTYTRDFLVMASKNKKPQKSTDLKAWMDDLAALTKAVNAFKDNRSEFANLMSALAEAVQCLSWLYQDLPAPFIENFVDGTLFWSNKVLVAKKKEGEAGAKYVTWCNQFKDLLQNLQKFAKANCTTGVVYNNKGETTYAKGGAAAAPAPATAAAAPAAPAAAKPAAPAPAAPAPAKGDIFAGITSIDQSSGKTAGLKKVEKSEMTHKNADLRAGAVVKAKEEKKETLSKPANLTCANNRWTCEYQTSKVEINIAGPKEEVYIFGCAGAVIIIKGKFKTLTIDSCKKTSVVLDSVISTVEVVNCKAQKVQVLGNAPACAVDKTDGFSIYLSKDSHSTNIVTSKSSDMNANFEIDGGEWKECPIPEQFKSLFEGGHFKTTVSDLYHA